MISGRQALGSIERTMSEERAAVAQTEAQLQTLLDQEAALRKSDLDDFRSLARLRLDDLRSGEMVGQIERVERQALALISKRDAARQDLEARIAGLDRQIEALRVRRETEADAVDAAQKRIAEAETGTRNRLAADPDYVARGETAHRIDIQAANADEKARESEAELAEKRAAYEANALFTYLWRRGFGTPDYSAFPFIRALDGWVARLIGYADARANFARLQEIPKRLRDHADRLAAEADSADEALSELWQRAREADGIGELDAALAAAETTLAATDAEIAAQGTVRHALLEEHALYASGEDAHTMAAVDLLAEEARGTDLGTLLRDARETLRTEDDRIVSRLLTRLRERQQVEAMRAQLKAVLDRRLQRLGAVGSVASEFNRRRYASPDSVFRDGTVIALLLRDLLDGTMADATFWDQLRRQQMRRRPAPRPGPGSRRTVTFGRGGGGFGRPGGFGRGGGGRSSGGGFSTGGGF
jgi:hypothetical protein